MTQPFAQHLIELTRTSQVFAVLDGAQFDNLPQSLLEGNFVARSLYLDRGDNNPSQVITAPHLIILDERTENPAGRPPRVTIPALMALIEDKPRAVFWQCEAGADQLFKHLRGINMVLYPKDALPDWEEPDLALEEGETPPVPDTHTMVTFRHADANVMAQVLPAVNFEEEMRLCGPAQAMFYQPAGEWSDGSAWMSTNRPVDFHDAKPGSLRLSSETIANIGGARDKARHVRVLNYVRGAAPEQTAHLDDAQLQAMTTHYMQEAADFGVKTDAAVGRWCYLQTITNGAMTGNPGVRDFMTMPNDKVSQEERVRILLQETMRAVGGQPT